MRTINEVVVDVLANPEAYTDAFPVAGPERVFVAFDPETATITMDEANFATGDVLTPAILEAARQRMLSSSYSREPRGMQWPPMTVDFMRRMLEERSPLLRGTWSDGETRFVRDESHPRDRVTMVNVPLREDSVAARMMNQERRLDQRYFGDGSASRDWEERVRRMAGLTTIDDPSMGTADQPRTATGVMIEDANRRHYRVSSGRCVCGFTSMFDGDMARHLEGPVSLEWWTVCECGASALCQQVSIPHRGPFSYGEPFDPSAPPRSPTAFGCASPAANEGGYYNVRC